MNKHATTNMDAESFTLETELKPNATSLRRAEEKLIHLVKEIYGGHDEGNLVIILAKAINTVREIAKASPTVGSADYWVRLALIAVMTEVIFTGENDDVG